MKQIYLEWFERNGFISGFDTRTKNGLKFKARKPSYNWSRFYKIISDIEFKIVWNYDDSLCAYKLKWQARTTDGKFVCETNYYDIGLFEKFAKMITHIKNNTDKMFVLLNDNINTRLNN